MPTDLTPALPRKCILCVEDNYQNRRLVRKILMAEGYAVLEAEDGLEGVALAREHKPDLILMDINMSGMDGMEATAHLKASELAYIPIIALTAAAMKGDRERIMTSGCDEYMHKPIEKAHLIATLRQFLGPTPKELAAAAIV
jgi:two-component system cell cycle response regulator DivK